MSTPTAHVGRITGDVELRQSAKGTPFVRFDIAVTPYMGKDEPHGPTEFHPCVAFGTLATHLASSLRRGDRVVVTGREEVETWTDRQGEERTSRKVLLDGAGPDLRFNDVSVARQDRRQAEEPF